MRLQPLSCVSLLVAVGCGEPYPTQTPDLGSGGSGQPGSTGGSAGAVSVPGTGGTTTATGGIPGQPGSGGTSQATGGSAVTATGGTTNSGGVSSGGFNSTGGNSGGTSSGGSNRGGTNSGGKSSGGTSGGGKSSGGASSGGSSSSGGTGGGATGVTYAALCASCHGQKGEGVSAMGPEIQHPVRDFSTWVVRNGRQGHPSFPKAVMAAFPASALPDATLNSFWDALSTPAIPKPTTGAALYADYCANCHGATGAGGPAAHDAKGQSLSKALSLVRSGHSLTQFSLRNGYMPKWSTSELSDGEVGLIVTHLDSL